MRYSKHRQQIYRFVCESREHPTAQMVYDALRREEPRLSLGTVYRNLNQLADAGQLKKFRCRTAVAGLMVRFRAIRTSYASGAAAWRMFRWTPAGSAIWSPARRGFP